MGPNYTYFRMWIFMRSTARERHYYPYFYFFVEKIIEIILDRRYFYFLFFFGSFQSFKFQIYSIKAFQLTFVKTF